MSQFVTIPKTDKMFWPMLTGRFSNSQFAQPVRSLNVNSVNETVTFKIIERNSLSLPGALAHWYSLARNIYLIFPIVGGLSYLIATHGLASPALVISSLLSLQFFLLSLTLYNDYSDYVNGIDRINEYNSHKPLVQGLVRPFQARQLSIFFFGLSLVFASYCFYMKPSTLPLALLALLIGFSLTSTIVSRRFKGVSLVATFLLGGPLLILGYEFLLFNKMTLASAWLGSVFGYHALKYDFSKQVRDIFYSSKARVVTLSNIFGFERSKFLYTLMSLFHLTVLVLFALEVQQKEVALLLIVALCFEAYINSLFYGAPSFLSSNISYCLSLQKLHYTIESSLIVFIFLSPVWLSLF